MCTAEIQGENDQLLLTSFRLTLPACSDTAVGTGDKPEMPLPLIKSSTQSIRQRGDHSP
jgi:hypothetical protein